MTSLQLYGIGWFGILKNIWPVLVFIIVKIPDLRRWERDEEKRLAQVVKRDKLKREHHQEHIARRY